MRSQAILKVTFVPALTALLVAVCVSGCGGGGGTGGGGSASQLASEGWNLFTTGDYADAVAKFNQAIALDGDLATAYDGLGWCYARMGELETAKGNFLTVLTDLVEPSVDTYAGASIVYLALKDHDSASKMANWALDISGGDYEFSRDPDVTDVTLRLIRAISRFHLGLYESAQADVEYLGGPNLNEDAPDFVAKLLEALQDLREQYGQGLLNQ